MELEREIIAEEEGVELPVLILRLARVFVLIVVSECLKVKATQLFSVESVQLEKSGLGFVERR